MGNTGVCVNLDAAAPGRAFNSECQAPWDRNCNIPLVPTGGACAQDRECALVPTASGRRGVCRGGRCCNAHGATDGCEACD